MNKQDIEHLYRYNRWANAQTLIAASRLDEQQFTRDLGSSHASVRDTLAHTMAAEWIWVTRWLGTSPKSLFDPKEFPSVDALRLRWAEVERDQADVISGLSDDSLAKMVTYTNTKGEEWTYSLEHMMQHVVNHSSYHRGQVTALLRQLGAEPIPTDLLYFVDAENNPG